MPNFPRPTSKDSKGEMEEPMSAPRNGTNGDHSKSHFKKPVSTLFDSLNYTIQTVKMCPNKQSSMKTIVVCVCSAVDNFKIRQAIRKTWGSEDIIGGTPQIKIIFLYFVGRTSNNRLQNRLLNESMTHEDIVQTDFLDTYRNLTLKSVSMLRWVSEFCQNASYVVKVDDDCFLNVPFLVKELAKTGKKRNFILGYLLKFVRPVRDVKSKYYVSSTDYHWKIYPNYVSGSCYIMSGDVVLSMFNSCLTVPFMPMEDIFVTGICAKKIKVSPSHNSHFVHWKLPSNGCEYQNKITGHWVKPEEFYKIWQDMVKLKNKTYKCVLRPRAKGSGRRHRN